MLILAFALGDRAEQHGDARPVLVLLFKLLQFLPGVVELIAPICLLNENRRIAEAPERAAVPFDLAQVVAPVLGRRELLPSQRQLQEREAAAEIARPIAREVTPKLLRAIPGAEPMPRLRELTEEA